jgi:hypothetical protein
MDDSDIIKQYFFICSPFIAAGTYESLNLGLTDIERQGSVPLNS